MQPSETSECLGRLVVAVHGVGVQVGQLLVDRLVHQAACQLLLLAAKKTSFLVTFQCTAAVSPGQCCSVCLALRCFFRQ